MCENCFGAATPGTSRQSDPVCHAGLIYLSNVQFQNRSICETLGFINMAWWSIHSSRIECGNQTPNIGWEPSVACVFYLWCNSPLAPFFDLDLRSFFYISRFERSRILVLPRFISFGLLCVTPHRLFICVLTGDERFYGFGALRYSSHTKIDRLPIILFDISSVQFPHWFILFTTVWDHRQEEMKGNDLLTHHPLPPSAWPPPVLISSP